MASLGVFMDYKKFLTVEQIIFLKKKKAFFEDMPDHCIATKSIFIHIPKSAGMSVVKALYNKESSNHETWREYYRRDSKKYKSYFKFAFVRHPLGRFISAYEYLMKGGKEGIDEYWRDKYLSSYKTINDFIILGGLEKAIKGGAEHFLPQVDFICDSGVSMVDFIARFETLDADFQYISSIVGGDELEVVNKNEIKREVQLETEAVLMLENIYKKDYAQFGYDKES